jgi:hypothetical protein
VVGNLTSKANPELVKKHLGAAGEVTASEFELVFGQPRYIVTFSTPEEAHLAVEQLDDSELDGRRIKVALHPVEGSIRKPRLPRGQQQKWRQPTSAALDAGAEEAAPVVDSGDGFSEPSSYPPADTMLSQARAHIHAFELPAADRELQAFLEASPHDGPQNESYLHLLVALRLKQRRVAEAREAHTALLESHPHLAKDPAVLLSWAWIDLLERDPGMAQERLEAAAEEWQEGEPSIEAEVAHLRALIYCELKDLESALVRTRAALFPDGVLRPLDDPQVIALASLHVELLALLRRVAEAEALALTVAHAAANVCGPEHVTALCAVENHATMLRKLKRPAEAVALMVPIIPAFKDRLGPHELVASALGTLTQAAFELHFQYASETDAHQTPPRIVRENLVLLDATAQEWVALTEQLDPSGADCDTARSYAELARVACNEAGFASVPAADTTPADSASSASPT